MEYIINKNLKGKVLQETTTHALLLLPDGSRIVYSKSGLKKAVDSGLTPIQTKEKKQLPLFN
jgi:hypothetical protein